MNFFQFLKSLDDLLYEVVSWILFYPLTMWRSIRHPQAMMAYADAEVHQDRERRFDANVSPPLPLLLTVLVAHGVELSLVGQSQLLEKTQGLAALISDNVSLILLRLIAFAIYPLIMAARTVRLRQQSLSRSALEGPFFAQCYACAPFALVLSLAISWAQIAGDYAAVAAIGIPLAAIFYFIIVEISWFRRIAGVSTLRASIEAILCWILSSALLIAAAVAVDGDSE